MVPTLPSTNADPMADFRARVLEKLRADIGRMLPDEVLNGLVEQAVKEQFFKERRIPQSYGADERKPSWFVEAVAKLGEPIIREHIKAWFELNGDTIKKATQQFLDDKHLLLLMMAAMAHHTQNEIYATAQKLIEMSKRGY